jgi:hypothetical protein
MCKCTTLHNYFLVPLGVIQLPHVFEVQPTLLPAVPKTGGSSLGASQFFFPSLGPTYCGGGDDTHHLAFLLSIETKQYHCGYITSSQADRLDNAFSPVN